MAVVSASTIGRSAIEIETPSPQIFEEVKAYQKPRPRLEKRKKEK